ncbi:MAG: glycoside hydrolase family 88 protein [Chitinophagaceae bacterium]|nr:glycoside hydrolase family 88 protein [Chitinophagaceae bacterium]
MLYHGWDESKEQKWANKTTGQSPNFWGRSLGWYGMALVDVLDHFPVNHPKRAELITILHRFANAVKKYRIIKQGCGMTYPICSMKKKLSGSICILYVGLYICKRCKEGLSHKVILMQQERHIVAY